MTPLDEHLVILERVQNNWVGPGNLECFIKFSSQLSSVSTYKLSDAQVMVGAAAILSEKFGALEWVKYARLFSVGHDTVSNPIAHNDHELLKRYCSTPELGIAILRSQDHTMLAVHTGYMCFALDGRGAPGHPSLQLLSSRAWKYFRELDFPDIDIEHMQLWAQKDEQSCGYHVLDFIQWLCLHLSGNRSLIDYLETDALDPTESNIKRLAEIFDNLVLKHKIWSPTEMEVVWGSGAQWASKRGTFAMCVRGLPNRMRSTSSNPSRSKPCQSELI